MLTAKRWEKEAELIRKHFPHFVPFAEPPWFGFEGCLRGSSSGRNYEVVLEGNEHHYPQYKPAVYINPQLGPNWVTPEFYGWSGRPKMPQLCAHAVSWNPALDTFASMLLRVIAYVEKWDA